MPFIVLFVVSAIALVIVRKLRGRDNGVPGVPEPEAGPDTEYLHLEVGESREAGPEDRGGRTVISYNGSEVSDPPEVEVSSYTDPGVTSYTEAGQPPPWGHHGPGPGPLDTYGSLLRTQGSSQSRVKLNPLFHQYS